MQQLIRVVGKSDIQSGTSANGDWERQTLVGETMDDNPTIIPIEFFGKKIVRQIADIKIGDLARVTFRIRGREYNGRWFCNVEAIRIEPLVLASQNQGDTTYAGNNPAAYSSQAPSPVYETQEMPPTFNPE